MKWLYTCVMLYFAILTNAQSCEVDGVFHFTYNDIKQILNAEGCGSCHGANQNKGNWNYSNYTSLSSSGDCNDKLMLVHGNASQSYLFSRISGKIDICGDPNDESHKISTENLDKIEKWINFGAPEDCLPLYSDIRLSLDESGCNTCHNNTSSDWRYDSYEALISNGYNDNCADAQNLVVYKASSSLLYDKINNDDEVACGSTMTDDGIPLSSEKIKLIRDWINGGAPEDRAALPVELVSFMTSELNKEVALEWTTATEIATSHFIVERSSTGSNFEAIGQVQAIGNSTQANDYTFIDKDPLFGNNYYRLRIVDFDGSFDYSLIRLSKVESADALMTIFPNPLRSGERLTVRWLPRGGQETTYLSIVDPTGEYIYRKIIFEGTNYVRLPILLDGVYYVIVEDYFGGQLLERMVIIN